MALSPSAHPRSTRSAPTPGSTLIALAAGIPLALVPLFVDGPANAARVAQLGAGVVAETPAGAGRAVAELLTDAGYRAAARAVAGEIAALPPVDEAIAGLEATARDGNGLAFAEPPG
jgi:UDP:flavonoid glycosyltransferase YjiC (YdhE family)